MNKYFKLLLVIFIFLISFNVSAKEKVKLYFFHGAECPHCAEEKSDLLKDLKKDKDVEIIEYEVWHNEENAKLLDDVQKRFGTESGVPYNVIGDTTIVGYSEANKNKILRAIAYCKKNGCRDTIGLIQEGKDFKIDDKFSKYDKKSNDKSTIKVPFIGKIKIKNVSLISAATIIGLVDGFNPCAMWVLLFLITTLIGMKDKKRMIILCSIFLLTSGLFYFLMMFSWLHIVVSMSTSLIIRNIIALFALGAGIYNLYNFYKNLKTDDGCEVVDKKKRKDIFKRIKKFTHEKSLLIAICGIILLAISVNLVELLCSAGLPVVFSELLAINNISGAKAVLYDLVYVFFFLIDDIIVFAIAIKTTDVVGISSKYNKYSHLIAGIIMLLIGILLLFKPGWLMFNF